jgi:hypothetical protein
MSTSEDVDRYVEPEAFLCAAGCRISPVLTVGNALLDAHELERIKAGAKFRWYGHMSADTMIGSKTSRGDLTSYIHPKTALVVHEWNYDN